MAMNKKQAKKIIKQNAAKQLWVALTGQIAYNGFIDPLLKTKEQREKVQIVRAAHLEYINTAMIASVFIDSKGLAKEYRDFEASVKAELALIAAKKGMEK